MSCCKLLLLSTFFLSMATSSWTVTNCLYIALHLTSWVDPASWALPWYLQRIKTKSHILLNVEKSTINLPFDAFTSYTTTFTCFLTRKLLRDTLSHRSIRIGRMQRRGECCRATVMMMVMRFLALITASAAICPTALRSSRARPYVPRYEY